MLLETVEPSKSSLEETQQVHPVELAPGIMEESMSTVQLR